MTSRENGDGINSRGSLINLSKQDIKPKRRGESIETYQGVNNNSIQNDLHKHSVLTQPNLITNQNQTWNDSQDFQEKNPGSLKIIQNKSKVMTLRSLHEIIYEIYSSKIKFDQKCHNNKLPLENMDQYMYTFLNQRYGLRSLTITHASSIIKAIKYYSSQDFETLLFGKILQATIPESYRGLISLLNKNLIDQIRQLLLEKYAGKSETFL